MAAGAMMDPSVAGKVYWEGAMSSWKSAAGRCQMLELEGLGSFCEALSAHPCSVTWHSCPSALRIGFVGRRRYEGTLIPQFGVSGLISSLLLATIHPSMIYTT
jgi:hypothetical protein